MKKTFAGIFAVALLAGGILTGCSKSEDETSAEGASASPAAGAAQGSGAKSNSPSLANQKGSSMD